MNPINIIMVISVIASISILLKKYAAEYSLLINILMGLIVIAYLVSEIIPVFNYIKELINLARIPEKNVVVLFKSLGICFLTQFASDSCRDAQECSLASKIEVVGKIAILTTALPLFEEITKISLDLMGAK